MDVRFLCPSACVSCAYRREFVADDGETVGSRWSMDGSSSGVTNSKLENQTGDELDTYVSDGGMPQTVWEGGLPYSSSSRRCIRNDDDTWQ